MGGVAPAARISAAAIASSSAVLTPGAAAAAAAFRALAVTCPAAAIAANCAAVLTCMADSRLIRMMPPDPPLRYPPRPGQPYRLIRRRALSDRLLISPTRRAAELPTRVPAAASTEIS